MIFNINQRVQAIDEDFEGVILTIGQGFIEVQSDDGFVVRFRESELIAVSNEYLNQVMFVSETTISEKEESLKKRTVHKSQKKAKNNPPLEVDLHINKLVKNANGLSNYEMLTIQLDTVKRQLMFAIKKGIQRVVFIHGVGEGVLKEELLYLLRQYDDLKYYDADFKLYGSGATEVYLSQRMFKTN